MYVELDNEDVGKPVSEYFGVDGETPSVSIRGKISIFIRPIFGDLRIR